MGLCPSRKKQEVKEGILLKPKEEKREERPMKIAKGLRADAEVFVPSPDPVSRPLQEKDARDKAAWEQFLDLKMAQINDQAAGKAFLRQLDGTFTSEYRRLLDTPPEPSWRGAKGRGPGRGQRVRA